MESEENMDISLLIKELQEASDAYYNGSPIMTDAEFDFKMEELKKADKNNWFLKQIGAKPTSQKWPKIKHEIVHGSQHKVKTSKEFYEWSLKIQGPYVVQHKLDGITLILKYKNGELISASTRGSGTEGEEIYKNVILCDGIVKKAATNFNGHLRCELILPTSKFKKYFYDRGYKNERNSLGVIRSDEVALIKHFRAIIFDIVSDNQEFKSETLAINSIKNIIGYNAIAVESIICNTSQEVIDLYNQYNTKLREELDYLIDGLVIKIDNIDFQKSLGHTDDRPNGQIALKFPPKVGITYVNSITWQMGTTGRIAPVAEVTPVDVDGITISRVTLNNIDWMKTMNVGVGDKVKIARANDVIPIVAEVLDRSKRAANPYSIPNACPKCGGSIAQESVHFICPNIECSGLLFGNIQRWIVSNNMMGIGPSLIREMLSAGYSSPADLYRLTENELTKFTGSDKTAKKLKAVIDETRSVRLDTFLYGLNIDALGSTNSTRLAKKFDTLKNVLTASEDQIQTIDGIATNAKKIRHGIVSKVKLIKDLIKVVNVKSVSSSGPLAGSSICITGELWTSRSEIHKMIVDAGGEVKTSVSKGLTFLATDEPNSGSSKNKKAAALGVKLIDGNTLQDLIEGRKNWKALI